MNIAKKTICVVIIIDVNIDVLYYSSDWNIVKKIFVYILFVIFTFIYKGLIAENVTII